MTVHVDPAHPAFERLPREDQARIYHAMGWSVPALADEFEVSTSTVRRWVSPEYRAKRIAYNAAYRKTEQAKAANRKNVRNHRNRATQQEAA